MKRIMKSKRIVKESMDDMEKEFTYKGVTITRYDYESLPDPMAASKVDDKTMQRIAYDIYDYLSSAGWTDEQISKYLGSHLDDVLDDDWEGDLIKDEFWRYMEKAAIENGMKYYEDMPEGEYVDESSKKRVMKESYEVSPELADRLNSILADEFLAAEFYRLAELAMKGNKQHRLSEIADENGEDELEDHFKNLSEWMQSKGIRVVTNHDEMLDITGATVFTVEDGDSTKDIVDKLIQSEEEAIEAYEELIPDTDLDLHTMLCGFLKDEREHLKALTDARDEMGGSRYDGEDKPKHTIYESFEDEVKFRVHDIDWDIDLPSGPIKVDFGAPLESGKFLMGNRDEKWYISKWLYDKYETKALSFKFKKALNFDSDRPEYIVSNIKWDINLPKSVEVDVPADVVDSDE